MRAFYVPAFVLALILSFSLLTCAYAEHCVGRTSERLGQAEEAVCAGEWDEAERLILEARREMTQHEVMLHMILQHQELDEAEKMFAGALAACRERDTTQTRIKLYQLLEQLRFLAETQKASLQNIF